MIIIIFSYDIYQKSIQLCSCSELGNVTMICHMLFALSAVTDTGTLITSFISPYHKVKEVVLDTFILIKQSGESFLNQCHSPVDNF